MARTAYHQGRLLAALAHVGATDEPHQLYVRASVCPSELLPALRRAQAAGFGDTLMEITDQIPDEAYQKQLTDEQCADFGLGYYHQLHTYRTSQ